MKRRVFLGQALAGLAAACASPAKKVVPAARKTCSPDRKVHDAVVIGSGFGGAVTARRLAEAGLDTLLIERGKDYRKSGDPREPYDFPESGYGGPNSPIRFRHLAGNMATLEGVGFGGGSLVYLGANVIPQRKTFEACVPSYPYWDELEQTYFPLALREIGSTRIPDHLLASDYYQKHRQFAEYAQKRGGTPARLTSSIDWSVVEQEIAGERVRDAIGGEPPYSSGAMNSLDKTYLHHFSKLPNTGVMTETEVVRIADRPGGGYRVFTVARNHAEEIDCHKLFLCAGTGGTNFLLLDALNSGSLTGLPDKLGDNWGGNYDFYFDVIGKPHPGLGGGPIVLGYHFDFDGIDATLEPMQILRAPSGPLIPLLGIAALPECTGTLRVRHRDLELMWDGAKGRIPKMEAATKAFTDALSTAWGGAKITPRASTYTGHTLGGVVIGQCADDCGRIKGKKGLYAIDGSLLPGYAGAVNPSLQITAIAERALAKIVAGDLG